MTEKTETQPAVSPEFFIRVNDFLAMARRIERRHDSHHAELTLMHAFARYSAHHYRVVVKEDSAEERGKFADYIADQSRLFVLNHLAEMDRQANVSAAASKPAL